MSQEGRSINLPNIIVFGQTGAGKSSLINMLAGKKVAETSSGLVGGTETDKGYEIKAYKFWDTCGLNEGDQGTVPAPEAINRFTDLVKRIGVSLIIYCVYGPRFTSTGRKNYDSLCEIIPKGKVPIVLVVTGLEQEQDLDAWWTKHKKGLNESWMKQKNDTPLGVVFKGHACVTTIKGRKNEYEREYQESMDKVWGLVKEHCSPVPWRLSESHNIILFGEAGSGKSSIVNMIVGHPVAKVSSPFGSTVQCTFQHERFEASIDHTDFNVYDTVGLNEGEQGYIPHWKAVYELYTLIRGLVGVSLLVYCMRGRIKENTQANWMLFNKVLCANKVPIIAVETGLELEEDLGGRPAILRKALRAYGMVPKGVACVVSVQGKNNEHEERYKWSQSRLRQLIMSSYRREPWSTTTDDWIGHIYKTTYGTKFCIFPDIRVEFAGEVENVVDEFIREVKMENDKSEKLKSTLLVAEKAFRDR